MHRVLTQAHRWFEFYENGMLSIENQLEILARNIVVESALGSSVGQTEYRERVAKLPLHWKNSHHLRGWTIADTDDGSVKLEMDVIYQNVGREENGAVHVQRLQYTTLLADYGNALLPRFTSIKIEPSWHRVPSGFDQFRDAYADNRLRSLVHYWFSLIECYDANAAPFGEILTSDFTIEIDGSAHSAGQPFQTWLAENAQRTVKGTHHVDRFQYEKTGDNEFMLDMDLYWSGYQPEHGDVEHEQRVQHRWRVIDNPSNRFASIAHVDATVISALAPVPAPSEP